MCLDDFHLILQLSLQLHWLWWHPGRASSQVRLQVAGVEDWVKLMKPALQVQLVGSSSNPLQDLESVLARDGNGNSHRIRGSQNPAHYVCRYGIHGIPAGRVARDGTVFRTGFRAGSFKPIASNECNFLI